MKAYWKILSTHPDNDGKRRIVIELENQKEHDEFHKGGVALMTTYHIHKGEEDTKYGGVGIIFDVVGEVENISETGKRKDIHVILERLTYALLLQVGEEVGEGFLVSNCTGADGKPLLEEDILLSPQLDEQWSKIKKLRLNGRACQIFRNSKEYQEFKRQTSGESLIDVTDVYKEVIYSFKTKAEEEKT